MLSTEIDYTNVPVQAGVISDILGLDIESDNCFFELEKHISSDAGVATLVMRVVNSPFYSHGNKITNIPRAISLLGFNVVRSLAILAFSRSMFAKTRNALFHKHVWQHSLLTALASQAICMDISNKKEADEAFIAGLMHDMGKGLMLNHKPSAYLEVLALVLEEGRASIAAEQQIFGCDHTQVGAEAVRRWKIPDRFIDFMGIDLSIPRPDLSIDPVRLSLSAANCLIGGLGIGARPRDDKAALKSDMLAFGLPEALCDRCLQEEFLAELMGNDTYQLCASL